MFFWFYCIVLHSTQRIEFVVFIKSVYFGTLISVENSHFNEYSVCRESRFHVDKDLDIKLVDLWRYRQ